MVGPIGGAGGQRSVKVVTFWLVLTRHFCAGTEGQTQPVNQAWSLGCTNKGGGWMMSFHLLD